MSFESFIIGVIFGSASGMLAGLLPGVGATVTLLLFFPIFLSFEPYQLIIAFVSMYSMAQYTGSVPAILLGIPGEVSAMPVLLERKRLLKKQLGQAIAFCAIGGFIGSIIVLTLVLISEEWISNIVQIYRTPAQVVALLFVYTMMIFFSENRKITNIILIIVGTTLGLVGIHGNIEQEFMTFGNIYLIGGLPIFPVVLALFVLPGFLNSIYNSRIDQTNFDIKLQYILDFFKHIRSSVRGTILGFFGGFCPGLTAIFSSQLAYSTEQKITKDPLKRIVSSETANNAGAFSAMLPLLVLAIPISSSEALVLSILQLNAFDISTADVSYMIKTSAQALIIVNILGVIVSWFFAKYLVLIFKIPPKPLYTVLFIILCILNYYVGNLRFAGEFYMWVLICLMPIGLLLRKVNAGPLIFTFVLTNHTIEVFHVAYQLYI